MSFQANTGKSGDGQLAGAATQLKQAVSWHAAGRNGEAMDLAMLLSSAEFPAPHYYQLLGGLLAKLNRFDVARDVYRKLIDLEPVNANHHYNIAAINRFLGDLTAAEAACNRAIELNPLDIESIMLRSDLRTQRPDDNHVVVLEQALQRTPLDWRGRAQLLYTLAKELEDLGEHQAAFARLKQGADLRRRHMNYKVANDEATIEKIIEVFDEGFFRSAATGHASAEPIFIVGLPRTGTTLLERILGGHSAIHSMGELDNFARVMMAAVAKTANVKNMPRQALVDATANLDGVQLGRAYIESTRPQTGHTPHFIDKLPLNFLYAGLIHRAMPNARIIHVVRSPMDACYAIYKQLFKSAYPYSYDLDDLGRYYVAYHGLMEHWRRVMPNIIYELHYERLVDDTEREVVALLDHLGLALEDGCLAFSESKVASTTASAAQVRQPIYRSSIGRWRQHESELATVRQRLDAAGIAT